MLTGVFADIVLQKMKVINVNLFKTTVTNYIIQKPVTWFQYDRNIDRNMQVVGINPLMHNAQKLSDTF